MSAIDYLGIVVLLLFMGSFVHGARMEQRSPVLWGGLSLFMWLVATQLLGSGLFGGALSQLLLIGGLTGWDMLRERAQGQGPSGR